MKSTSTEKPKVLAIIPARGGSKGVPRKNIIELCGKPLISYSIEVALKSQLIDRVIVSTEDEEIAEISRTYGADVPFLRPPQLADDRAKICDALEYTLNRLEEQGYQPEALVNLYPTHIFRTPKLVDFLIQTLLSGYQMVKTVKRVCFHPWSAFQMHKDHTLIPFQKRNVIAGRGEKTYFRSYGVFMGQMLHGRQPYGVYLHFLTDPISLIDIDSYEDLHLAQLVIEQANFDFAEL
jgi:CMP-N,N'-diacetyllegionaminic acid synthase